jgi:hypothetical protein
MENELSYINRQHKDLFTEFDKRKPIFQEVRDYLFPYLGFFEGEEANSGDRLDEKLLRTISIEYANILAAGMQWGITSPTRPWVKYRIHNYTLMQREDVRQWLETRRNIVLDVLDRSNFYPSNHQFYMELGVFNTAAMLVEEDDETAINCRTFTCGEFAIGLDKKGRPNRFARNIKLTPFQIVEQFGIENVPDAIKTKYNAGQYDGFFDVKHLICPNKEYNPQKMSFEYMKFTDYYWMDGQIEGKYLRKSGFNEFPVMVERWQVRGSDIYGTGPGIWSLGDAKQIQLMWKDICTAAELAVKPPTMAPTDILKSGGINLLPAGANYYNPSGAQTPIQPVFQVNFNMDHAAKIQEEIESCIRKHFKVDVFQLISELNMGKGTRTAREIIELTAEKMSQMGPLLERLQTGYLPQVVERVDRICERMGLFPPPPPILEQYNGAEIKVEYVSVLSQAQKQNLITPILDTVGSVIDMSVTTQLPEILDKVDFDKVTDNLGILNGIPEEIIVDDERVQAIRQARAERQAMIDAAAMGANVAQTAKTASQADMSGNNALTQVLGGPSGGIVQ